MQLYLTTASYMYARVFLVHKEFGIKKWWFFSWVCREGTNFSCVAAQECYILHLNYTGFLSFTINVQHLYQLLQCSPIFSNHSLWLNSTHIYISCKHSSTHPIPSALSDEDLNLQEANQRQSRSKACAEHHTFLLTQFEILWRPPDPQ